jgi:hypothetical protein
LNIALESRNETNKVEALADDAIVFKKNVSELTKKSKTNFEQF